MTLKCDKRKRKGLRQHFGKQFSILTIPTLFITGKEKKEKNYIIVLGHKTKSLLKVTVFQSVVLEMRPAPHSSAPSSETQRDKNTLCFYGLGNNS